MVSELQSEKDGDGVLFLTGSLATSNFELKNAASETKIGSS